jgi:uncharacterized protein (TIGR00369 family)
MRPTHKKQPNSRGCFACGLENTYGLRIRFVNTKPGEVGAEYKVADHFQGYPGIVHGGVVAAMLDEICARAFMGSENTRFMFTAKLEIKYRQHVPTGEVLKLVGRQVQDRRNTAVGQGIIYSEKGQLLAEAEALLINVPDDLFAEVDLTEFGWKVYPD